MAVRGAGYVLALLHAPKTGGTARSYATRDIRAHVLDEGHSLRASMVYDTPRLAVVREPVDRFLSAWAHQGLDASELDRLLERPAMLFQHTVLRPQVHWYDRPDIEHLIAYEHWPVEFVRVLRYYALDVATPLAVRNPATRDKLVLTPAQAARIQAIYDEDHELWLEASA